jgi:uncharacterized protein YukE
VTAKDILLGMSADKQEVLLAAAEDKQCLGQELEELQKIYQECKAELKTLKSTVGGDSFTREKRKLKDSLGAEADSEPLPPKEVEGFTRKRTLYLNQMNHYRTRLAREQAAHAKERQQLEQTIHDIKQDYERRLLEIEQTMRRQIIQQQVEIDLLQTHTKELEVALTQISAEPPSKYNYTTHVINF